MMGVDLVLKLLEVLTSPDSKSRERKVPDTDETGFDSLLKTNMAAHNDILMTEKYQNVRTLLDNKSVSMAAAVDSCRWRFVCSCLDMLTMLQKSIANEMAEFTKRQTESPSPELKPWQAPPLSPDNLSIGHQKMLLTAIQFIVTLGIAPNLDSGVGLSLESRSEFTKLLLATQVSSSKDSRNLCLFYCVKVFMSCVSTPSLSSLIMSRHLNDLLASLLTLLRCQKSPAKGTTEENIKKSIAMATSVTEDCISGNNQDTVSSPPSDWTPASVVDMVTSKLFYTTLSDGDGTAESDGGTNESHGNQELTPSRPGNEERQLCEQWLHQLLEKVHPSVLVREILVLQSGAPAPPTQGETCKPKLSSPVWLRKICGRLLTDILMKPNGVIHVLQGMLEITGGKPKDWRKCDAVAKVIACCPMLSASVEEYYAHISPQIMSLLHHTDKRVAREFLRVACTTISRMVIQQPDLTRKYLLSPLMEPLERCSEVKDIRADDQTVVVVKEDELSACLEDVHKVFVVGCEPNGALRICLLPVSHVIFSIYCFTRKGVAHLGLGCQEILVSFLRGLGKDDAISCLHQWIFGKTTDKVAMAITEIHPSVGFAAGDGGGVVITTKSCHGDEGIPNEMRTAAVVEILKELQKEGLTGDFFLSLLMELTGIISQEVRGEELTPPPAESGGQELLEAEIREKMAADNFHRKLSVLSLLAAICEEIGPSCLKNTQQTLKFVQVTLERGVQVCKNTRDEALGVFESETLTMAMGMLTAVLTGTMKIDDGDRQHMEIMMPLLEDISSNHPDNTVQEMASDLRVAIATHGVIWSELLKSSTKGDKQESRKVTQREEECKKTSANKPLVEVIGENEDHTRPTTQSNRSHTGQSVAPDPRVRRKPPPRIPASMERMKPTELSALGQAFEELHDPLIPVRGHALIVMNKLIQSKDPEAMNKREILLNVFKENLHHPDSYLYLASINGLVSLVDKFAGDVIPVLTKEFLAGTYSAPVSEGEKSRRADDRVKVGECLVQISRKLGDMAVKYRGILLNAFLHGCRDDDAMVRASSLSNIGELCKVLRFSLGNFILEIFMCGCAMLRSDSSVEVRQAAALMINLQIQGLGKDTLKVLEPVIMDVYRTLGQCMSTEKQDEVKMQITLTLRELDSATKDILFPERKLEKKIRVLDPI